MRRIRCCTYSERMRTTDVADQNPLRLRLHGSARTRACLPEEACGNLDRHQPIDLRLGGEPVLPLVAWSEPTLLGEQIGRDPYALLARRQLSGLRMRMDVGTYEPSVRLPNACALLGLLLGIPTRSLRARATVFCGNAVGLWTHGSLTSGCTERILGEQGGKLDQRMYVFSAGHNVQPWARRGKEVEASN